MQQQECKKCKVVKDLTEENFESQAPGQFNRECRICRSQYYKGWRAKKDPEYLRRKALRELYATTIEWYDKTLEEQGNHCALCEAEQYTHRKRLGVDHDHNHCPKRGCGKCNRGILCATCNYKVGQIDCVSKEAKVIPTPGTWTEKAVRYIETHRQRLKETTQEAPHNA